MDREIAVHLFGYVGIVGALSFASWSNPLALVTAAPILLWGAWTVLKSGEEKKERIDRLEDKIEARTEQPETPDAAPGTAVADGGHDVRA